MSMLIVGLVLFLGIHLVPTSPPLRRRLVSRMGENGYKGLFSIVSVAGLVFIVWGFARAPYEAIYAPLPWARPLTHAVMPFVFILLAAANMPGHIRRTLKHPMLIAVFAWAVVHLLNNGDVRSILLFGSFALYAVADLASELIRGKTLIGDKPPRWSMDLAAVVSGLVLFWLVMRYHGTLFGMPVV